MVKEGEIAPEFKLKDDEGNWVSLADLRGRHVVLFFYPKDDTPGCTTEACSFRDEYSEYRTRGIDIVGVSADTEESHEKFKSKFHLRFPLLSDPDKKTLKAYGVWKEKSMYGKKYMGIERTTIIIDENGKIEKVFSRVKPAGHAKEVLESFSALKR